MQNEEIRTLFNLFFKYEPEFRSFVKENGDKTIEELAMEFDIDLEILKKFL